MKGRKQRQNLITREQEKKEDIDERIEKNRQETKIGIEKIKSHAFSKCYLYCMYYSPK